jgi:hypothetical protein
MAPALRVGAVLSVESGARVGVSGIELKGHDFSRAVMECEGTGL